MCLRIFLLSTMLVAWCMPSSYAGWWQDPALGNSRGAATDNSAIFNSPYYNPNLPAGGLSPYVYNPSLPYGRPPIVGSTAPAYPYASPVALGGGFYNVRYGGTALRFWQAPSGYYYPWSYGGYPTGYVYPIAYQYGKVTQASPPVTTVFNDMQSYLDDSKTKGRLSENDYTHLNRRLHDLIGKSEEINGEGSNPDQDPDLQQDVKELGLDIAHRIKPAN